MDSLVRANLIHGKKSLSLPISPFNPTLKPPSPHSSNLRFSQTSKPTPRFRIRVSSNLNPNAKKIPLTQTIKTTAGTLILTAAAAVLMYGKFSPARAESPAPAMEEKLQENESEEEIKGSPLSQFLDSHSEAIDGLKSLLQRKLEDGEDLEALKILKSLVSSQPLDLQWKFLMARLLNEMGEMGESRKVFEEILAINPLSFEALFENALIMDRSGEGDAVIERLREALEIAKAEEKDKEARDVRLIMAQIQFLQKNVEEALRSYKELAEEDPKDFRPYFCQGVIYSLLDRNKEAREQFSKYHELSPRKFEVEGFLRTPLSRMKLFGPDSEN
ncbi:protein prenylyltransferase superfamily protein [Tasmannia lanceolata]|uniref:protein prenylyltransferase superfamily protein n=1 Tax=Tasmannia lanceolata TaxID=3420 RepID=UPI0040628F51